MISIFIKGKNKDGKECTAKVSGISKENTYCLKKLPWLTCDQLETYISLCKNGVKYNHIGDLLGISHTKVHKIKRYTGIKNRFDEGKMEELIVFLLKSGATLDDISDILFVSRSYLEKIGKKFGLKRNKSSGFKVEKRKSAEYFSKLKKLLDEIY